MKTEALIGALLGLACSLSMAYFNMAPPLVDRWAGKDGALCMIRRPGHLVCDVIYWSAWPTLPPGVPVSCVIQDDGWFCRMGVFHGEF